MRSRSVPPEAILELFVDRQLVSASPHVDEIDHDDSAQIPQAQLAGDLLRRLEIGSPNRIIMILASTGLPRVYVDRNQSLGLIDHQGSARLQPHLSTKGTFNLPINPKRFKKWLRCKMSLHFA